MASHKQAITVPTDPESTAKDVATYLLQFGGNQWQGPYVHPRVISWSTSNQRQSWVDFLTDTRERDTVGEFARVGKGGKNTWVGFMDMPVENSTGQTKSQQKKWYEQHWHCCTCAVISKGRGNGKVLVIYDCDLNAKAEPVATNEDPNPAKPRKAHVLRWGQRGLYQELKRTAKVDLWYSVDHSHENQDRCLELSLRKVEEWASFGDMLWMGEDDPRVRNCIQITDE